MLYFIIYSSGFKEFTVLRWFSFHHCEQKPERTLNFSSGFILLLFIPPSFQNRLGPFYFLSDSVGGNVNISLEKGGLCLGTFDAVPVLLLILERNRNVLFPLS